MGNYYEKPSLGACLLMDGIGMSSYIIPGIGEGLDVVWFLFAGIFFYKWFGSKSGAILSAAEELLPFLDIVPTFTLGYFICDGKPQQ